MLVKKTSNNKRCEICHKSDLFREKDNYCSRCSFLDKKLPGLEKRSSDDKDNILTLPFLSLLLIDVLSKVYTPTPLKMQGINYGLTKEEIKNNLYENIIGYPLYLYYHEGFEVETTFSGNKLDILGENLFLLEKLGFIIKNGKINPSYTLSLPQTKIDEIKYYLVYLDRELGNINSVTNQAYQKLIKRSSNKEILGFIYQEYIGIQFNNFLVA